MDIVGDMRNHLYRCRDLAQANLPNNQDASKGWFEGGALRWEFTPGEMLVLIPLQGNPLEVKISEPY